MIRLRGIREVAGVALFAATFLAASTAWSAHHFQSGLAGKFPAYDLNDAYVFKSERPGYTVFILSVQPSAPGKGDVELPVTEVFGQGGVYSMHIARGKDLKSGLTLTFVADGNRLRVGRIDSPNAKIGETGTKLGEGEIGQTFDASGDLKVWAGRVLEPFFGNGAGIPAFHESIAKGQLSPQAFQNAEDLFVGAKTSAIVVEVPNAALGETAYYFITSAMMDPGHHNEWVQINRKAHILMPYVFFGDTPTVQIEHDQHRPDTDGDHMGALSNNIYRAAAVTGAQADPTRYANDTAALLTPDVLSYRVGTSADYSVGVMNGRALHDDAMDTVLSLYVGKPMTDHVKSSGNYRTTFPYVVPAR